MDRKDILLSATQSREILRSQLKAVARAHSDRIRKIDNVILKVALMPNEPTLPGIPDMSLDEETQNLIEHPLSGL
jgi:hypothetical protein